jgi:hypothetical protein
LKTARHVEDQVIDLTAGEAYAVPGRPFEASGVTGVRQGSPPPNAPGRRAGS